MKYALWGTLAAVLVLVTICGTSVLLIMTHSLSPAAQQLIKCPDGKKILKRDLDKEAIRKIVDKHNNFRNDVAKGAVNTQDPAENMRTMTWDSELAMLAQSRADKCAYVHDFGLKNSKGERLGQNLGLISETMPRDGVSISFQVEDVVGRWFNEVNTYGYKNNGETQKKTGHYSQVIWANTYKVGCGYTAYDGGDGMAYLLIACNYYPIGNWVGSKAYEPGKQNCEKHKLKKSHEYSDLCVENVDNL